MLVLTFFEIANTNFPLQSLATIAIHDDSSPTAATIQFQHTLAWTTSPGAVSSWDTCHHWNFGLPMLQKQLLNASINLTLH